MNDREKLVAVAAMGAVPQRSLNQHLKSMLDTYNKSDEFNLNPDDTTDVTEQELEKVYMKLRSDIDTVENDA